MTINIVPTNARNGLKTNCSASESGTDVLTSLKPSWADLIRAERKAGGPSVSESRQMAGGAGQVSPAETPTTNAIPSTSLSSTVIVGFQKLKKLLKPVHSFFKNKGAFIEEFRLYDDGGQRTLVYPKVKAADRDNPYRRYQLNHKASSRTFKRIKQFVEDRKLGDFALANVVITMPKAISEYLASQGHRGRDMAWRLYDGWWEEDLPSILLVGLELANHVNLHPWRTEKPCEPHFHFHSLIPNYGLVFTGAKDDDGEDAAEFKRWEWHKQRGGQVVPFGDEQLSKLKELWQARLVRFCKRHGIDWLVQPVDIYVEYVDTWVKLHNKLNYNGRHWTENYAEYSNDNPECPDPPEWLQNYENKARVKGWWSNLKNITTLPDEKEKISPYTGEKMAYYDKMSLHQLVKYAGTVGAVEFSKGKAYERELDISDILWLKGVMLNQAAELWDDDLEQSATE